MKIIFNNIFELISCLSLAIILFNGCKTKDTISKGENKKPNIIFILADDLGAHDLSYAGSKFYETPNIDALAKEGTIFMQGYAAAQVCSPSRASILTGKFTAHHGITDWIGADYGENWAKKNNTKMLPPNYNRFISKKEVTIAEALKQNGYKTFFAGKWHLGNESSIPENYGFQINKGGWEVGNPKGGYYAPWENPKLDYNYKGENLTMRLAEETTNFISENKDKPFFAFLSFYAVHTPLQTTQKKWKKYRDKAIAKGIAETGFKMERVLPVSTTQENPIYGGLVETMDDAVGVVLEKLKALHLDKNTIIVFTSDNGGLVSSVYGASATSNFPLRGGKGYQWEGGIREPYLIKVPYLKNNPKKVNYPVSGIDFYPTLLDLAGIQTKQSQKTDGISLLPLLKGESINNRPLFWHYPHYGNQGGEPTSIIRKGDWKLIHYWEDDHDELYNLLNDPSEKNDVSKNEVNISLELRSELDAFLLETKAVFPNPNPNYNIVKAKEFQENRKSKMLVTLEKRRKKLLEENYKPNIDWWSSNVIND